MFILTNTFKPFVLYKCIMPKDSAVKGFEFVDKMYPSRRYICSTYGDMLIYICVIG